MAGRWGGRVDFVHMWNDFIKAGRGILQAGMALAMLSAGACGRDAGAPPGPREDARPVRVVSLSPAITEIICAIGAEESLVGRSSVCTEPKGIADRVPVAGEFGAPVMETLVKLRPAWVLVSDMENKALPGEVAALGIGFRRMPCRALDDVPRVIRETGALVRKPREAENLARRIEAGLSEVRARSAAGGGDAGPHRPRVYVEIWGDPAMSVGGTSFISELVTLASGTNIMSDVTQDYFNVSPETVVRRDPEVIFSLDTGDSASACRRMSSRAGWSGVSAVKNRRCYGGLDVNLIERPGPRILQAVEVLQKYIHPPTASGAEKGRAE